MALAYMNDTDDDGGHAGPLIALAGRVDRAAVRADPTQAGRTRVALPDRVSGDQAETTVGSQQVERAAEKVGYQVGVAVRLVVNRLQPVEIAVAIAGDERVLARKRRVADDAIETGGFAGKDFGELDFPVKGTPSALCGW